MKSEIKKALFMWVSIIVPSVFPYLVLADYITKSDIMNIFEKIFGRIFSYLFKLNPCSVRAVICSVLCGYPSGAISADNLCKAGAININEAKRLVCFTNNAGPLFLICAVGASMLGSARDGFAIYIIQILSAFIYAIITSVNLKRPSSHEMSRKSLNADLCESVNKSVITIINICGFMLIAYSLSACIMIILKKAGAPDFFNIFIKGFFEISSGVSALARPCISPLYFGLICCFVSWSGISVIMQIRSAARDITDFKSIMLSKGIQSVTSFILGFIYKSICGEGTVDFSSGYTLLISLSIGIILFIITRKPPSKC